MKLGEAVYKEAGGADAGMADGMETPPPGDAGDEDAPQPDNVVDAEFEELDDEDKNQRSN